MKPYKFLAAGLLAVLVTGLAAVGQAPPPDRIPKATTGGAAAKADPVRPLPPKAFKTGLKRTPQHKLKSVTRFAPGAAPAAFAVVPKQLSVWLNDRIGDCVSAFEVAYRLAAYSVYCTGTEVFLPDNTLSQWVYGHGYDNGADLADVMTTFQKDGVTVNGVTYKGGPFQTVDYSNETTLQSAITVGPVPIAIDANALPSGAGQSNGWYATGGRPGQYGNTDHCVGFTGYGSAAFCFGQLGKPVPAGIDLSKTYYMVFTWGTVGVVDHAWVMSTTTEAYVGNPTIVGMSPPAPTPPVPPTPVPPPAPQTITLMGTVTIPGGTYGHWPTHVTIPDQTVTVTVSGPLPGPQAAGPKVGLSLDVVFALMQLAADIRASGHGNLAADLAALMGAIRSGSGMLPAFEKLAADLIQVGADPSIIADLLRIATDLGIPVPSLSPLRAVPGKTSINNLPDGVPLAA